MTDAFHFQARWGERQRRSVAISQSNWSLPTFLHKHRPQGHLASFNQGPSVLFDCACVNLCKLLFRQNEDVLDTSEGGVIGSGLQNEGGERKKWEGWGDGVRVFLKSETKVRIQINAASAFWIFFLFNLEYLRHRWCINRHRATQVNAEVCILIGGFFWRVVCFNRLFLGSLGLQ